MIGDTSKSAGPDDAGNFRTTHWSVVQNAGQPPAPQAYEALTQLCQTYWQPVCDFIRRRGQDPETAKDLTQSFFVRLIESPDFFRSADQKRGLFRTFLLTSVRNFVSNVREREAALKRGGGAAFVPIQAGDSRAGWFEEPADTMSPEKAFDRRWALTVIEQALSRLQREFVEAGKGDQFPLLQEFLPGRRDADLTYAEAARRLNTTESAVRQAAHRMRNRFRELLVDAVAQTVTAPDEIDNELSYLMTALSG
jgi:RNA polymerase sigma-70 factor (ECF subfamily)